MPAACKSEKHSITEYVLKLFVSGVTDRSRRAIANLNSICEQYLKGHCELEVVDVYQLPGAAQQADIIAVPTLIREFPLPAKRILGDLSERGKVLILLDIKEKPAIKHKPETKQKTGAHA